MKVKKEDIRSFMQKSYLDYSVSVIIGRSIPDVRDGLKPIHRRILYEMYRMGIKSSGGTKKCAKIIGNVLGSWSPHGKNSL